MTNNGDNKEYAQQRMNGGNWMEKAQMPSGGLEAELNSMEDENQLAYANWN